MQSQRLFICVACFQGLKDSQDLCFKACTSLQCSKVSILFLEKDRHWLVQLAYATSAKFQGSAAVANQAEGLNVYEGYRQNGIALSAVASGDCVNVSNVNAHPGYDPRLDDLAGIQGHNCLAAPIMTEESKTSACCLGVLFASNKIKGGFLGAVVLPCHIIHSQRICLIVFNYCAEAWLQAKTRQSRVPSQMQQQAQLRVR